MDVESTSKDLTSENQSAIFTEILKIKNTVPKTMLNSRRTEKLIHLYRYITGIDESFNIKFIEAEIRKESLNKGYVMLKNIDMVVQENGFPGDQPELFIGKDLGGSVLLYINAFPLNSKLNITKWKNDQAAVYNHIKNGQNCFARIFYGIKYDINKKRRPYEIYYHFKLYQNNTKINGNSDTDAEIAKETIEGKFINSYP